MTKKAKRREEALRRLGGTPPPPPKPRKCEHPWWRMTPARPRLEGCNATPTRCRPDYDGVEHWYCAAHDPLRLDAEEKNRKQRIENKKARWKQMEKERKA